MTSDPHSDLESNSGLPDAESISTDANVEVNSPVTSTPVPSSEVEMLSTSSDLGSDAILPDTELNSVLLYLQSHPVAPDFEVNSAIVDIELISSPTQEESNSLIPDVDAISTLADLDSVEPASLENRLNKNIQVQLKTEEGKLLLILPTESQLSAAEFSWDEIWQQIRQRLQASDRFRTPNTPVHLLAQDRLLDSRQLQELSEVFGEVQLQLKSVATSRRQTAIAAVSSGYSVEQLQPETSLSSESKITPKAPDDALYLETTVRSGVEIRHSGTVIILGDLNPGGIVIADGDILVWGRLRGVAHAGALGNRECLIMALQMEPTQLRIADAVARAPEKSLMQFSPEVAHITPEGIRISKAIDFSRSQLNRINLEL
jgi:septum site-determining protein MinC